VPEAIVAFLDSDSYKDAVRNAVSLGGDADTLACITGGMAEAFYGPVSPYIRQKVREILTPELGEITKAFSAKYRPPAGGWPLKASFWCIRSALQLLASRNLHSRFTQPSKLRGAFFVKLPAG